jgi:hypothetical protein
MAPKPPALLAPRSSVAPPLIVEPPAKVLMPVSRRVPPPLITRAPAVALPSVPPEPFSSAITPLTVSVCPLPGANVMPWTSVVLSFWMKMPLPNDEPEKPAVPAPRPFAGAVPPAPPAIVPLPTIAAPPSVRTPPD